MIPRLISAAVLSLVVGLLGCSRGPTYAEALQTEMLEQQFLERFAKGGPKLQWLDQQLKSLSDPKDRAALVEKHKDAIARYEEYIVDLKKARSRFSYAIRVRKEIGRREGRFDEPLDEEEMTNARRWHFDREKGFPEK
jgi:hypothetical protein